MDSSGKLSYSLRKYPALRVLSVVFIIGIILGSGKGLWHFLSWHLFDFHRPHSVDAENVFRVKISLRQHK